MTKLIFSEINMKQVVMYLFIELLLLSEIREDLAIGPLKRSLFVILPMFVSSGTDSSR